MTDGEAPEELHKLGVEPIARHASDHRWAKYLGGGPECEGEGNRLQPEDQTGKPPGASLTTRRSEGRAPLCYVS